MVHRWSRVAVGFLCSLMLSSLAAQPREATFTQPATLMVPYPAGSASDYTARTFQEPLAHLLGVPVVVENLGAPPAPSPQIRCWLHPRMGKCCFRARPMS
ncbi:hypothetical protein [Ottowia sp. VDI28]|uniref:hypothetical protein n=1 Tax=Ottowia sp. VDI28 TaxID=3133968 RepID=UPI003C300EEB